MHIKAIEKYEFESRKLFFLVRNKKTVLEKTCCCAQEKVFLCVSTKRHFRF